MTKKIGILSIFIKSHGSRFHSWLPLNLSVWYPR